MSHEISRRAMLAGAGTAGLLAAGQAFAKPFFTPTGMPLGVQLYALGEDLTKDFDGTLAEVARIGYRRVELAGFMKRSATELRASFDRAGLQCQSAHVPIQAMFPGQGPTLDDMPKLIDEAHILGLRYVVLPMFPLLKGGPASGEDFLAYIVRSGSTMSIDDWRALADLLNEKGAALAKAGLRMAYHNHNFEFAPKDGTTGFQTLMERTDPKLVSFEMDAGWAAAAGIDPIVLLKRYPGRFRLMHVKDIKASTTINFALKQDPTTVGTGKMDWPHILPAARAAGIDQFYVEQEPPYTISRIEAVARSFRYLASLSA